MKALKVLLLSLLALLLLLPAAQMSFRLLPARSVNGIDLPRKPPVLSKENIIKGVFQETAEQWVMKRNGLWGALVRLDNELNVRLFKQLSSSYKSTAHAGNDGYFFQSFYLGSLNRTVVPAPEVLDRIARNLRMLQDLLAARGMPMVLLISTNAIALYPDIVPEEFLDPSRTNRLNSYDVMRPLLARYGVNFIDGHEYLMSRKDSVPYKFFAPTASHWNDVATCWITDELLSRLESMVGKRFPRFTCEPIVFRDTPRTFDLDLLQICNLWDGPAYFQSTPYIKTQPIKTNGEEVYKPKLLFVGTSFLWSTLRYLDHHKTTRSNNFYFYFSKLRRWPQGSFRKIERAGLDWEKDIFSHDALILEINMAVLQNVGHGFIEEAIRRLGGAPLEVNVGNALEQFLPGE